VGQLLLPYFFQMKNSTENKNGVTGNDAEAIELSLNLSF
jgi:hypothetical protein